MLLPGPEAHELAIYIGWLLHRVRGGIVAGTLFVIPGLFVLTALSLVFIVEPGPGEPEYGGDAINTTGQFA